MAEMLVRQVSSSVYFEDTIRTMEEAGIDTVLEIGPGKALSGFVKKTCRQMRCFNIEDCDSLQKTVQELIQLKDRESEQKPVSE